MAKKEPALLFAKVLGQERPRRIIGSALAKDRLAQSYLFHGPGGVGKELMAWQLAQAINCAAPRPDACGECPACRRTVRLQHPDVKYLFPVPGGHPPGVPSDRPPVLKPEEYADVLKEKAEHPHLPISFAQRASIGIDWIKHVRNEAAYHNFEGKWKVFIIRQAEAMTAEAANAFLKILEEPSPQTMFILTTTQPQSLLPTILSRCQQVRFEPLDDGILEKILTGTFGLASAEARLAARLGGGSVSLALEFAGEEAQELRGRAWRFFELVHTTDMLAVFDLEKEIVQGRNTAAVEKFLSILLTFYRDMLIIGNGQREQVVNLDYLPRLEKAGERYSGSTLVRAMQEIGQAVDLVARNVHLRLLIITLHGKLAALQAGKKK